MRVFFVILIILFTGCSLKINPNEYNPYPAPKAEIMPTKREINFKPSIIVYSKKDKLNLFAKNILLRVLNNSHLVNILDRNNSIKDEIKLAEEAKLTNSDLNQADYAIFLEITSTSYNYRYIPPTYYKDKKGHIHKIPGYYKYTGCIDGYIKVYSLIPYQLKKIIYLNDCESTTDEKYLNYKNYLLKEAVIEAIDDEKYEIFKIFTPKGFIFEIRKKDDDFIIHTTLGSKNGAKEGERVNIYTRKKISLFGNEKIEEIKIGEGIISNIVHENDSWIIVKKLKRKIHIGDYVKMNYKHTFWDIFRWEI